MENNRIWTLWRNDQSPKFQLRGAKLLMGAKASEQD